MPETRAKMRQFWEWLIPPQHWQDPEYLRQARRVAVFNLAMLVWVLVFAPVYVMLGAPACAAVLTVAGVVLALILLALRRGHSPTLCGNLFCLDGMYAYTTLALLNGGRQGPSVMWYATVPIIGVYTAGLRWGVVWTLVTVLAMVGFSVADSLGWECLNLLTPDAFRTLELLGRVGLVVCLCVLVGVLTRFERAAQQELYEANCRLEMQSAVDGLTGVANRRSFDRRLQAEWEQHEQEQLPLSVALIDVDWFKQYNDTHGHLAGDDVIRKMAQTIQASLPRPRDLVARFGGDEFAVILPDTNDWYAEHVLSQLRSDLREMTVKQPAVGHESGASRGITISVGIATTVPKRGGSAAELIKEADVALYRAKAAGRDRTTQAIGAAWA
ncbi:MAG TPA: GGDEF domain-containing protein [Pirellulales bacterium]